MLVYRCQKIFNKFNILVTRPLIYLNSLVSKFLIWYHFVAKIFSGIDISFNWYYPYMRVVKFINMENTSPIFFTVIFLKPRNTNKFPNNTYNIPSLYLFGNTDIIALLIWLLFMSSNNECFHISIIWDRGLYWIHLGIILNYD